MCVILPEQGPDFVASLPVKRFHGVGPKTNEKMARLGIHSGADLREKDVAWLTAHFGSWGEGLHRMARGIDHRPVRSSRIRKSLGGERTYSEDKWTEADLREALDGIVAIVWERIAERQVSGRTVTLKVKFADFRQITRARSVDHAVASRDEFSALGHGLLEDVMPVENGVRLLGLTLGSLDRDEAEAEDGPVQRVFSFD